MFGIVVCVCTSFSGSGSIRNSGSWPPCTTMVDTPFNRLSRGLMLYVASSHNRVCGTLDEVTLYPMMGNAANVKRFVVICAVGGSVGWMRATAAFTIWSV